METIQTLLNGMSFQTFIAYYMMGLIGCLCSVYTQFLKKKKKGEVKSFTFFLKDTGSRLIFNFIAIAIGIIFSENLLGINTSLFGAFTAGLSTDVLIDRFLTENK